MKATSDKDFIASNPIIDIVILGELERFTLADAALKLDKIQKYNEI